MQWSNQVPSTDVTLIGSFPTLGASANTSLTFDSPGGQTYLLNLYVTDVVSFKDASIQVVVSHYTDTGILIHQDVYPGVYLASTNFGCTIKGAIVGPTIKVAVLSASLAQLQAFAYMGYTPTAASWKCDVYTAPAMPTPGPRVRPILDPNLIQQVPSYFDSTMFAVWNTSLAAAGNLQYPLAPFAGQATLTTQIQTNATADNLKGVIDLELNDYTGTTIGIMHVTPTQSFTRSTTGTTYIGIDEISLPASNNRIHFFNNGASSMGMTAEIIGHDFTL